MLRVLTVVSVILVTYAQNDVAEPEQTEQMVETKGICGYGEWMEEALSDVISGTTPPLVQCWRKPVCLQSRYADPGRCSRLKNPTDWPTTDPHLNDSATLHSFRSLTERFLRGSSVIFTGDSINMQVYQAAICEAAKEFELNNVMHYVTGPPGGDEQFALKFMGFFHRLHGLTQEDVKNPGSIWTGGPVLGTEILNETRTLISRKGWHKYQRRDMESQMQLADVLVVNYGHHYVTKPEEYEKHMSALFIQLEEFGRQPGKVAVFRETSADHLPVRKQAEADMDPWEKALPAFARGCRCLPHTEEHERTSKVKAFNDIVRRIQKRHPTVGLLEWYDLTAPRYDMHEGPFCAFESLHNRQRDPQYCCDCVHYCYTPVFWRHFFSRLYNVLDGLGFKPETTAPTVS